MKKGMYLEKRPTCVTVIGWAWIIIGGLMCFAAVMALLNLAIIRQTSEDNPEATVIFRIFPFLAVVQIGVGVVGLFSGINFLKLKSSSRTVLEVLCWLLLLFVAGFGILGLYMWISMTSGGVVFGSRHMGPIMGLLMTALYIVPLAIMLKYLRGNKVRNAMIGSAEQNLSADGK